MLNVSTPRNMNAEVESVDPVSPNSSRDVPHTTITLKKRFAAMPTEEQMTLDSDDASRRSEVSFDTADVLSCLKTNASREIRSEKTLIAYQHTGSESLSKASNKCSVDIEGAENTVLHVLVVKQTCHPNSSMTLLDSQQNSKVLDGCWIAIAPGPHFWASSNVVRVTLTLSDVVFKRDYSLSVRVVAVARDKKNELFHQLVSKNMGKK